MIWIYYYLLNGIWSDLELDNSCWMRKIPNFATNNINIMVFHIARIVWPREIEIAKLDCITNCLTDNSSNRIIQLTGSPAWLYLNKSEFIKLVYVFFKSKSNIS